MERYEIVYDYCSAWSDEYNIHEEFEGSWEDLQEYLRNMRKNGCYNIDVAEIDQDW